MLKKYQAAAYLRLSVAGSRAIESESIENQEYIIARFVKENLDIELVSSYADSGHSGLVFDRPAFLSMMSDAKAGKINCIIVKDLSRFGRDFIETGRYLQRILPAYGIRFISILDHVDTLQTPPQEDIVMQIKTILNDEFSREISARTRSSLQIMRKSGLYVGACPIYGYQKSADTRNKLVPDENTTPVVAQIFNLKLAGMSAAKIANRLNEEGILSPLAYKKISGLHQPRHGFADKVDAKWSAVTILRILKDETYTGTLVQGKQHKLNYKLQKNVTRPSAEWVRYNNAHEAIISLQDFETIQRILLLDTRASPSCDYVNLFSGLLICGSCQSNMTRKMVRHEDIVYRYYYCPTGKRRGCVAPTMISIDAKQAELQKLCEYKSSLKISEVRGVISAEECRDMDEMYEQEICKLEKEILAANNEIHAIINHIDQRVNRIAAFATLAGKNSFERADIVRLIKQIVIYHGEVTVEFVMLL